MTNTCTHNECISGTRLGRQSNSVKLSTLMEYQTDIQAQHGDSLSGNKDRQQTLFLPDDSMCDYDNSFSGSEHTKEQTSDSPPVSWTDSSGLGVSTVTAEKYKFDDFREVAVFDRSGSSANVSERFSSFRRSTELQMSDDQNLSSKPDSISELGSRRFLQNHDPGFRRKESRCSGISQQSANLPPADADGSMSSSQHEYDSLSRQQLQTLSKCRRPCQEDTLSASVALNLRCVTETSISDQQRHSIPSASTSGCKARLGSHLPSGRPDSAVLYSSASDYCGEVSSKLPSRIGNSDANVHYGTFRAASDENEIRFPVQDLLEPKGMLFDTANIANMMSMEETDAGERGVDERRSAHLYEDHQALFDYLSDAFKLLEEMMIRVCTLRSFLHYLNDF